MTLSERESTRMTMRPNLGRRNIVMTVVKLVVSVVLIAWILRNTPLEEIMTAIRGASAGLLVLAFSLHLIGFTISAFRWRMLLRTRGADASIRFLVESYIVGVFFNNLLPSTIGGDIYRAYDSWRLGQSRSSAVAVVFVDRFLGLLALMLFASIALFSSNDLTRSIPFLGLWLLLGTGAMVAFLWVIFLPPRWLGERIADAKLPFGAKVRSIVDAFMRFQGERAVLSKALALSILLQANVVLHYYLISQSLQLPIPLLSFFLIIPLAIVIMMLPISINGIGLRENIYILFFAAFGVSEANAVAFAWIAFSMVVIQGVLGGIVYAIRR